MENASKALLIAAAILIAIILIGVGVFVVSSGTGNVQDQVGQISSDAAQGFNNKFLSYEGDKNVKGSTVKALFDTINQYNQSSEGTEYGEITIEGNTTTKSSVKSGKLYTVEITGYNKNTGRINKIKINQP